MDVIFYEAFAEEQKAIKRYLPKTIKAQFFFETIQQCGHVTACAEFISVRTQSKIPSRWKSTLKAILTRSQGFDHLLAYRDKTDFDGQMGYLGNYCARAVAEHAILSMLVLFRQLKKQVRQFEIFDRNGLTGNECINKNVCVIGVGNIGRQLVDIFKGLKMSVRGVDIKPRLKNVKYVSLKKGVRWADVIICALPLTKVTKGLLNYNILKYNKRKGIFINVSRGEISPMDDLKRLLDESILEGVALDIYEEERDLADYLQGVTKKLSPANKMVLQLKDRDNVLFTPHNAFNTQEALEEKARRTADAVKNYVEYGHFPCGI